MQGRTAESIHLQHSEESHPYTEQTPKKAQQKKTFMGRTRTSLGPTLELQNVS